MCFFNVETLNDTRNGNIISIATRSVCVSVRFLESFLVEDGYNNECAAIMVG